MPIFFIMAICLLTMQTSYLQRFPTYWFLGAVSLLALMCFCLGGVGFAFFVPDSKQKDSVLLSYAPGLSNLR